MADRAAARGGKKTAILRGNRGDPRWLDWSVFGALQAGASHCSGDGGFKGIGRKEAEEINPESK